MSHSKKKINMKEPHDNWANLYDFVYEKSLGTNYINLTQNSLSEINRIITDGTIIDYGAGTGRLAIPLKNKGYEVIAVEKSSKMAEVLKNKCEDQNLNLKIHVCSISNYKNGKADLALALFTVLNYSITEDELTNNLKNICEHLEPKGYFFFDLPGTIFFSLKELPFIKSKECNRVVNLSYIDNDIYLYKEKTTVIYEGEELSYEDEFHIKYWDINFIEKVLNKLGLFSINKDFSKFNGTGSAYHLYQKK
jgi:SAM-dependent methyltransferase